MQLKEKKSSMERDKRKLESELERQRQTIGKQVFLQVVQKKQMNQTELEAKFSDLTIPKFQPKNTPANEAAVQKLTPTPTESVQKEKDNAPRRQWDKSQKNMIDLENDNKQLNLHIASQTTTTTTLVHRNQKENSISTSSSSSSSASQSPPLNSRHNVPDLKPSNEVEKPDLSKAYCSRDEMIKTIEVLKSTTVAPASKAATVVASHNTNSGSDSAVKDIDSELLKANSKLAELQNEIARLSELQQQQQHGHSTQKSISENNSTKESLSESNDLNEELTSVSKTDSPRPNTTENNESHEDENPGKNYSFYLSLSSICFNKTNFFSYRW